MVDWVLRPYDALGSLHFGMSPDEVASMLGPPKGRRAGPGGKVREGRNLSQPRIFYIDNKVVEIELISDVGDPLVDNLNIFQDDRRETAEALFARDQNVYRGAGALVFLGFGFSTDAFNPIVEKTLGFSAFARNYWDDSMDILQPVSAPIL